ncbi:integrase arm-type DNA-binding domain-containing protein [Paucibacter sp. PLA-PC-4]|uniref:tyrosine-type recombinase/integrase n=1 Tax=Paucibacter sp. PLA-PC-4 TaxID=2993655 RepID=UPI0022488CBF|nr:integrase arm-type DNA-binding domain-containing protein [Paucibacter sp. PLA-PC-4]MCX2861958.1 integrase arm-type DNA-binding domain-containing protein [Paucibacter sp. PLA-PC-4]
MATKQGPHVIHRLSPLVVKNTRKPGYYADGGNLYLQVSPGGAKSWLFRFRLKGRSREMGLGPLHSIDLEAARQLAKAHRTRLLSGVDPIDSRNSERSALLAKEGARSDRKKWSWCCETYVADVKIPELTNAKHAAQWGTTLSAYTYPLLGDKWVDEITLHDVFAVLKPIWLEINETATRVRSRMEAVWGWAKVKNYCSGDNPAVWKANLQHLLSSPEKVQDEGHHPSLPYERMGAFMTRLHEIQDANIKFRRSISPAMALEFAILTAMRTNPIILATWSEIDEERRLWTVPTEHMKGKFPIRVPLSARAMDILQLMKPHRLDSCPLVFQWRGVGLYNTSMLNVIGNMDEREPKTWIDPRMEGRRVTVHGFRSTLTDWAAETTDHDFKVYDKALAHSEANQTVAAYLRGDMLAKRRLLMDDWAKFCSSVVAPCLATTTA